MKKSLPVKKATKKVQVRTKTIEEIIERKLDGNVTIVDGTLVIEDSEEELFCLSYILELYPFCCGMYEIGDIEIESKYDERISDDNIIAAIAKTLKKTIEKNQGFGLSCTIPFEKDDFYLIDQALKKAGFKNVGEFKNKNSGNMLKHYVHIKD